MIAMIVIRKGGEKMTEKMTKLLVHLPVELKKRLDSKRSQGYSLSGYVRSLLERELNQPTAKGSQKGR